MIRASSSCPIPRRRASNPRLALCAGLALLLSLLLALTVPAEAAEEVDLSGIDTARARLVAGEYVAAQEVTAALLADLAPRIAANGDEASYLLGTLHTLHALALSGQGEEREARWHWYFAQSVSPRVSLLDLQPFGVAGLRLELYRIVEGDGEEKCYYGPGDTTERYHVDGRRYEFPVETGGERAEAGEARSAEHGGPFGTVARGTGGEETPDSGEEEGEGRAADDVEVVTGDTPLEEIRDALGQGRRVRVMGDGVAPPVKVYAPFPEYSVAMREVGLQGVVVLVTIVDREGVPHNPCVLRSPAPGLAHLATQAVKEWRFEPATYLGEPVDVFYNLTINFALE